MNSLKVILQPHALESLITICNVPSCALNLFSQSVAKLEGAKLYVPQVPIVHIVPILLTIVPIPAPVVALHAMDLQGIGLGH